MASSSEFEFDSNSTAEEPCDIDPEPQLRLAFLAVGSVIAIIGCFSNALLFYTFTSRSKRPNPFTTFLAFLDFMLCFLFILCFGAPAAATTYRIKTLYLMVKENSHVLLVVSRIVQMSIPYVLILNTADRLRWIEGSNSATKTEFKMWTLGLVVLVIVILRVPGYFMMEVYNIPGCDLFASKVLAGRADIDEFIGEVYRYFDISVQFLHLFVSFVVLFVLNVVVIRKLRSSHKRARRQSSCPQALNTIRTLIEQEEKREHKHLRYAIRTTIVLISSYLLCNSVNFILFSYEMWFTNVLKEEDNNSFTVWYVAVSDLGTNLFVFSSAIRMFIFYKYNPDIRAQLKSVLDCSSMFHCCRKRENDKKVEVLLGVPL